MNIHSKTIITAFLLGQAAFVGMATASSPPSGNSAITFACANSGLFSGFFGPSVDKVLTSSAYTSYSYCTIPVTAPAVGTNCAEAIVAANAAGLRIAEITGSSAIPGRSVVSYVFTGDCAPAPAPS